MEAPYPREGFRLVARQPEKLRLGPGGRGPVAADRQDLVAMAFLQLARLRAAARIAPEDGRADDLALRILEHGRVGACAERDGGDVPGLQPGLRKSAGYGRAQRAPPVGRVLLAPARPRTAGAKLRARRAAHRAVAIDDHRLEAAGADVDAHEVRVAHARFPASAPVEVTPAAVDADAFAVDEGGMRRTEERDECRHLLRLAHPPDRVLPVQALAHVVGELADELGSHEARRNGIGGDAERADLLRERPRETGDARLGGRVMGHAGAAAACEVRR